MRSGNGNEILKRAPTSANSLVGQTCCVLQSWQPLTGLGGGMMMFKSLPLVYNVAHADSAGVSRHAAIR